MPGTTPNLFAAVLFVALCAPPAGAQGAAFEERVSTAHELLEAGRADQALAAFEALAGERPGEPAAQFGRAAALVETGRAEDARPILLALERLAPEEAATQVYLLRVDAAEARANAARARIEKLRSLQPYADLLHLQVLEWLQPSGLDDLSLDQARFVLGLASSDAVHGRAAYLGGLSALRAGSSDAALELLPAAVEADPSKSEYWSAWLAAQGASDIGEINAEALERARRLFPDDPALLGLAALRAIRLERLDEARDLEPRIRERDPVQADLVLGRLELEALRFEAAAEAFRRAIEAAPGDARAYEGLGVALARMGHAEAAWERLEEALERAPDDRQALFEGARTLVDLGRLGEAAGLLERLLAAPGRERRAVYLMYQVQKRLGNDEEAQKWRAELSR